MKDATKPKVKRKYPLWLRLTALLIAGGGMILLPRVGVGAGWFVYYLAPYWPKDVTVFWVMSVVAVLLFLAHKYPNEFKRNVIDLLYLAFVLGVCYALLVACLRYSEITTLWHWGAMLFSDRPFGEYRWWHVVGVLFLEIVAIGLLSSAFEAIFHPYRGPGLSNEAHQRGRKLIAFDEARKSATKKKRENDPGVFFGFLRLPSEVATTHFAAIGATGSGKTLTLRLLMQSALTQIGRGKDTRALIYDAKQDMLSIIGGIVPGADVVTLNPFDKRGVAWDMAADITAPATAQQIATILVPENQRASQPFFADATRHLLAGVLISFMRNAKSAWTLRDVVLAMKSASRLDIVLAACPETKDLIEQYFSDETTKRNVMSTVATKMQRYEFIAAAWDKARRAISLREWLASEYILVLGNDEATRTALDAINQVIFKRLTELILAQTESDSRRTWVFLDELRQAGKLDGLSSLLTKGRSKGACVVLGFQDIEGLREVYGNQLANEIAGQCANKAILRSDSADTARWCSALFGEREVLETRVSHGSNTGTSSQGWRGKETSTASSSTTRSEHLAKRDVVLSSEIMDMPPTTFQNGLPGYYLVPSIGAYYCDASGDWVRQDIKPKSNRVLDIDPRSEDDQFLRHWDEADFKRLGLRISQPPPRPTPTELERPSDDDEGSLFQITKKKVQNFD